MHKFIWLLLAVCPSLSFAQLEIVPDETIPAVFAGELRHIKVVFRNLSERPIEARLQTRLLQASTATAIPLAEVPWKTLQLLAGQTVIETVGITFPTVKAATRFIVQWANEDRQIVGRTDVMVYPTDLLAELTQLAGKKPLGILDPNDQLKPLLRASKVELVDLGGTEFEDFTGKLAIIGPFGSKQQMPPRLAERVAACVKTGVAVVWIQPPAGRLPNFEPSFHQARIGEGIVIVAQGATVSGLAQNPFAQLNLIRMARLAVKPEPFALPYLGP